MRILSSGTTQSGQVGLAVILMMVLLSTVGISVATRATQGLQSSRQSEEATQTFSAAESALEELLSQGETYLSTINSGTYTGVENVDVNYTVDQEQRLNTELLEGDVAEIDISTSVAGNQVVIEWSDTTDCAKDPAALMVIIINTSGASPVARYSAYTSCNRGDNFTLVNTAGTTLSRRATITLAAGDDYIRIMPVYNDTDIFVSGGNWTLPTQQFTISSRAENARGRERKAIEVERSKEFAPNILDYGLVSGTSILK